MRGAVFLIVCPSLSCRIIPARAGSSVASRPRGAVVADHPRACGEQSSTKPTRDKYSGSSPRVRGAGICELNRGDDGGIIPARAGSRAPSPWATAPGRDHPRACGEQSLERSMAGTTFGSSPRVREAARGRHGGKDHDRIIPARAGSSSWTARCTTTCSDHPRACGEQSQERWLLQQG